MTLDLSDCTLSGSAVTASFLHNGLSVPKAFPDRDWDAVRSGLRGGSALRVHSRMTAIIGSALGYGRPARQDPATTREGQEDGGWLLKAKNGARLRVWSVPGDIDLDAPSHSIRAYRTSPMRVAQRVLRSSGERAGLVTNGEVLRLLLCDPTHADSHFSVGVGQWRQLGVPPDSFRVLLALAGAEHLPGLPLVLEAARLHQVRVTTELRRQAKDAIVGFINALPDRTGLDPAALWHEGLVLVYRLLFILKLESPGEPGNGFSFASTRLWRESLSPNTALGALVRRHLDYGHDTGQMLETGLRSLFNVFRDGVACSELRIAPLGGALFGHDTTPLLDQLRWGDQAVAVLLDRLIWLVSAKGDRVRVHYGSLDVEDLGSIYEGLLEQQPGIATKPLRRARYGKIECVVPADENPTDIEPGQFYLSSGMGRKASGSFYTPHEFVRFLVRETLDPKIAALSPENDPQPAALLTLKIIDPAVGSGHFLVETCRYLGEALLTACRLCDERGLQDRLAALPDPENTIAAYMPSRGYSEVRARAICRRLIAVHCLYGCDRNQLAVELAKLSLWLESYAEGLPLTFLDHRLVHGDALTGPFFTSLTTLPVTGGPLDPLLAAGVADRLDASLGEVRRLVTAMNASIGRDLTDIAAKHAIKAQLDGLLKPLRQLAKAWAGAAMLRQRDCDDAWLALADHVARTGLWPKIITNRQATLLAAGTESIAWDLSFPEVFPVGFSAVLGNPPWDVVLPNTKDFVADYDPTILGARTQAEKITIVQAALARPEVASAFEVYRDGFDRLKRVATRLYQHQRFGTASESTAGSLDLFRLFAERAMELTSADGSIGMLMPSAFHANEGTTGIRHLYLQAATLSWCLSFENRRKIFDIDSRFKFDLIVAHRPGPTESLRCGFYLDRTEDAKDPNKIMTYSRPFLDLSGGAKLTPLELRGTKDQRIAEKLFGQPERLSAWCSTRHIRFGCDLHMTADSARFLAPGLGDLVMHEGKTFHQYTDVWETSPRYSVASDSIKPQIAEAVLHRRLAFRDIARSNDERTMIAFIAPPGVVFGHTATVEKAPWARNVADALVLCALFNSFPFDWLVRQKAATHLSLYLLETMPVPQLSEPTQKLLAEGALRLSHRNMLKADFQIRASIDAMVAAAYGLSRADYEHMLGSFSHRSRPDAPTQCLEAFDLLRRKGP